MVSPLKGSVLTGRFSIIGSGDGYRLLGEVVRALDPMNPQVAARLAGAFESWRRYDLQRQEMLRAELEAILAQKNLSPNLFEVASKILG